MDKSEWIQKYPSFSERKDANFTNLSWAEIQPVYAPEDIAQLDDATDLGLPGEYPYTRGIHASLYRSRLWTMRQFAGFGSAADTNQRFRYLLEQGQTGLSTAFDMPTLMGFDSDHPKSLGEVGREGVAVDTWEDMERLFHGIPLDKVSTSMTINAPAIIIMAMYILVAEKQGVPQAALRGTLQNDMLKEYIAQKEWIYPPEPAMRIVSDMLVYGAKHLPQWNMISISGYHIREAGSTAVQELAFTLADGFAYVEAGIKAGLDVDDFAPRLSFFFNSHNDFFEEIAKFRAARRIWARTLRDKYHAQNPRSCMLRFHTQTAGCTLTAQQPENNIVRVACQALAAVLGGTQSLHTNSMDEALALPTEHAAKIALRTQQIIANETGVTHTVDPLGGSYYVEHLTDQMEEAAQRYFDKIEALGGVLAAIEEGFPQREIADAALRYQREIERQQRIIVGVNAYKEPTPPSSADLFHLGTQVETEQVERLQRYKAKRNPAKLQHALAEVTACAQGTDNLMVPILEALRQDATMGEIVEAMKTVFGEYRENPVL